MKITLPRFSTLFPLLFSATVATASTEPAPEVTSPSTAVNFLHWLAHSDGSSDVTAVTSHTYNGYKRTPQADGGYQPETYAFGEGGYGASNVANEAADDVKFMKIVRTIAGPLAAQNYVPGPSSDKTELLIMVYWGATMTETSVDNGFTPGLAIPTAPVTSLSPMAPSNAAPPPLTPPTAFDSAFDAMTAFQNHVRDQLNFQNARLLGYYPELSRLGGNTMLQTQRGDLISDLEDPRYYVILFAFDFQKLVKEKRKVLLWETRYSIRQRNNDFERDLAAMTRRASHYFGKNSNGLQRQVPFRGGSVELGDLKVVGFETGEVRKISGPESDQPKEKTDSPTR